MPSTTKIPLLPLCRTWKRFTEMYLYLLNDIILWLSVLMDESRSMDIQKSFISDSGYLFPVGTESPC